MDDDEITPEIEKMAKAIQYKSDETGIGSYQALETLKDLFSKEPWLANALLPKTHRVVPVEPTDQMIDPFSTAFEIAGYWSNDVRNAWREAVAAAPSGPEKDDTDV